MARIRFGILTLLLATSVPALAWAQPGTVSRAPAVEIDTSILGNLNPAPAAPSQQYEVIPQPRSAPTLTRFPITSRVKSDSINPAVAPTPRIEEPLKPKIVAPQTPTRDRPESVANKVKEEAPKKKVAAAPLPGRKPTRVAISEPQVIEEKEIINAAPAPLPKRRPDIQKASASFVAEARKELVAETKAKTVAALETPKKPASKKVKVKAEPLLKGKHAGPRMPAVPSVDVNVESLGAIPPPPAPGEMVASNKILLNDNKDDLVRVIEEISARGKKVGQAPSEEKVKIPATELISRDEREPLKKEASPDADNKVILPDEKSVARIEPAAGDATAPRDPDAPLRLSLERHEGLERVVVPFRPDSVALEDGLKAELTDEILPLLKRNPTWTVQIQSFASAQDGAKVAGAEKRASLSRALDMRAWLLSQGIEAKRIDIRALGVVGNSYRNPPDRVDIALLD